MLTIDYKLNHLYYWGKLYRSAEVEINWRVPTSDDIDMAFEILGIAEDAASRLEQLSQQPSHGDKVWTNDFCRSVAIIERILQGTTTFVQEHAESKTGGKVAER